MTLPLRILAQSFAINSIDFLGFIYSTRCTSLSKAAAPNFAALAVQLPLRFV
jgi:hypothetical protein